jgi:PAS domain S-box-containing protein
MAGQAQRATSRRNGKSLADLQKENAKLKKQLTAREHELTETLDQQTAVRDVLKVIGRSSFDLEPVLEIVTETAARLVGADMAAISRREGDVFRFTVGAGTTPETTADIARLRPFYEQHPFVPGRGTIAGRVALEGRAVQIQDITADPDYEFSAASTVAKMRSVLGVPLMREDTIVGTLTLARQRVEPFTARQIDLVQTFADQAVIAIENTRLIAETREALDQQTATAEVLGVINSSPGDLGPVFDAMLEKAMRLCEAAFGQLLTYDGERFHSAALHGVPTPFADFMGRNPGTFGRGTAPARILSGERVVHVSDLKDDDTYRSGEANRRALVDLGGARTLLSVPLLKDEAVLGTIMIYRQEVRPFSDKQIALLQNFAGQAVIAMENARLVTETREALDQQTATAEVLGVINASPGDLDPVFDAILQKAHRLCAVEYGALQLYDGEKFRAVATRGYPDAIADLLREPYSLEPDNQLNSLLGGGRLTQIVDVAEHHPGSANPRSEAAVAVGIRTILFLPLRKEKRLLGLISAGRQQVKPFSEKEIALLENFAAQAVIAMENARLITETREALEQQTATAEVLQVINSSPGDLAPVFDALLERAMQLCEATFGGLTAFDGERFHTLASRGLPADAVAAFREPWVAGPGSYHENVVRGEPLVHADFGVTDPARRSHPQSRAIIEIGKARTGLIIALRKDERLLGSLFFYRQEVRPFSDKQIALLQNFAGQAVIAMENARLLTETREALEQQTATAEVLQVINSSPGDLRPVFGAMLEKATHLCEAPFGIMQTYDGERFVPAASHGVPRSLAEFLSHDPSQPGPETGLGRIAGGDELVHIVDLADPTEIGAGDARRRRLVELGGVRTYVVVALRKEGKLLGVMAAYRQEVRPFSDQQIALLQNFGAQAVIAMENARLITETREALEQQTATAEVLGVINSSPGDLAPVFDAVLEKAMKVCSASFGELLITEPERMRIVASRGTPSAFAEFRLQNPSPAVPGSITARVLSGEKIVHTADVADSDLYRGGDPHRRALVDLGGARTTLAVALTRDREALGAIHIYREEVRPFSGKEIGLLQNFATQAVIAMENARLITETREALEQQTATAEVLSVINSSPGDLAPVFDEMLEKATRLCDAAFGVLAVPLDEERHTFRIVSMRQVPPALANYFADPVTAHSGSGIGRVARNEEMVHILDSATDEAYTAGLPERMALVDLGGARTQLTIALRKDGALLGAFTLWRQEVRAFSEKQIALLQNFAAQAVIAMENARLINETQEALEQQTATAEVLQVINASPGDLTPVFDAMLERAVKLCEAQTGHLMRYENGEFNRAASFGGLEDFDTIMPRHQPLVGIVTPDSVPFRTLATRAAVHVLDMVEDESYRAGAPAEVAGVRAGIRTALFVPLLREGEVIGNFVMHRREKRSFTDKQIALLQNFATQAVIAIENTRLITETREALEQQTATAEVLQVINSSPGDLGPVFDAMLEKALTLCGAAFGQLNTYDSEHFRTVATLGVPKSFAEYREKNPPAYGPGTASERILAGDRIVHIADLKAEEAYRAGEPNRRALVDLGGARTMLIVALLKDEVVLGTVMVYRQEVRPFSDKQIALLQNFAAQAVIAMENARLLEEIRQRQAELRVTFDNMGDGVVMFDENLRLAAWNRNFQEMLDLPDTNLSGRPGYAEYLRLLAERGEFGTENVEAEVSRRLENTGQEFRQERTRPDGKVIEVRRNAVPDGGFVLIYSDVTERKRSEAEIRAARDAAEAAYRDLKAAQASLVQAEKMASLGQLTAGIAHEIKNPLNFVNNFAGLSVELLDELKEATAPAMATLDEDKRAEVDETVELLTSNLAKIAEHGRRADNIVKSMLEHSRGATGERRAVDFNALVEEALNLGYHGARAQDQSFNITLERDYARDLAPIEIVPQDITRVCLNLFGNGFYAATKRQKEGGDPQFKPTLKVMTRDLGDEVEIRARDNGVGIPPEIKDKLFQPFFTTKPTGEGTGLGLSISYDIVTQQHGGTIEVDSRVGEFTEFTVRLPRKSVRRTAA